MTTQALTPRILKLKINQENKYETLKNPMFSLFDVIILDKQRYDKAKYLVQDFR